MRGSTATAIPWRARTLYSPATSGVALTIRVIAAVVAAAAVLATVIAAIEEQWLVAGLAGVAAFGTLGLGALLVGRRDAVRLRPDLADWLGERAAMTGEDRDVLADRALAHYRDRLGDRERLDG